MSSTSLTPTIEVARRYGVTPRRILAIAAARGVEPHSQIGRSWMWKASDVRRLKPGKPGNHSGRRRA